jgi:hypothetical protein
MTRSAVILLVQPDVSGALLVMAHPCRWAALSAHRKYQWQELKYQLLRSHTAS